MQILVLNAGSSSLKFAVYDGTNAEPALRVTGAVSGLPDRPQFRVRAVGGATLAELDWPKAAGALDEALARTLDWLAGEGGVIAPAAIGHRIVHGGLEFDTPVRLEAETLRRLAALSPLAPLHQPFNLAAVRAAQDRFPGAVQVGCFDTAFHAGQPRLARLYALPRDLTDGGVLAYGFHGLSYDFIAGELRDRFGPGCGGRVIVAHLGSGVSLCALTDGQSLATTMGFSALDGPPMATRSGSLDPGVLLYLMEDRGMSAADLTDLLYRRSGLLGVSGESGDVRTLLASDRPEAQEALDLFVYRLSWEIGGLAAVLGGADRLVFTAGVGENAAEIRARVLQACAWLGAELDAEANLAGSEIITTPGSRLQGLVLPTDEQIIIARAARALLLDA
ncbi:acetate/propionate family kinase [Phenylobacterium sp.]|jgi:acetate kinase|uniref:acetate/propionate family kinase n=1 Tax=Phenylobacterium sp. TaxID=1871053 RepID=UPI000C8E742B|nr:acetate/propionate family kinase [Phenylobacterium sp.]MAK82809.1 acetate kinase [Phenylobacterium sp.]|tara:strand:- start:47611 stop:48786 length:1176 start_codon:yes stop_codon:yes gene_type:complete